jgi:cytochrome c oxidase subunit IV
MGLSVLGSNKYMPGRISTYMRDQTLIKFYMLEWLGMFILLTVSYEVCLDSFLS